MTEIEKSESGINFLPYIAAGLVALAIVLAAIFWPSTQTNQSVNQPAPTPPRISEPTETSNETVAQDEPEQTEPEVNFEEPSIPTRPSIDAVEEVKPQSEPELELDTSDIAVKTAIVVLANNPEVAQLIVNEDLLRRFVVFTNNLAEKELATNFHLLNAPEKTFRTYQQAGKEWIDGASFKRYTPYAQAFDAMPVDRLIRLYQLYKPAISGHYAEIGYPDEDFDLTLESAIDHLLDTPEIPIPVEVFSESVMYQYTDDRIENLSAAQKQLLRTGPENMRLIKAKLREVKQAILELN